MTASCVRLRVKDPGKQKRLTWGSRKGSLPGAAGCLGETSGVPNPSINWYTFSLFRSRGRKVQ